MRRKTLALSAKNSAADEDERELSFPFIQPENKQLQQIEASEATPATQPLPAADQSRQEEKPVSSAAASEESWSLPFPSRIETPSEAASKNDTPSWVAEPEFEKTLWTPPKQADENQPTAQLSTAPYLGLFVFLLALYGLFALNHASSPAQVERFLRLVPGIEWAVFKNNHLKQGIAVQSVTQKAQLIRGNREVFTISGLVVNQNPVSVREVRIEGYIFNGDGKEIGRQQISVGNPISANLIRDVEAKEISILQEIGPQKRFAIPPDESAPFLIVFLKPSKDIKSFAYRVLSAEEAG